MRRPFRLGVRRRDRRLTGRYNRPAGPSSDAWTHRTPTSTCWSSAPASPASTSCTAPAKPGFSALLLEAGGGVGGTWYWNRYPGARFDSESYTYAYLFSKELFDEWEWQEHFAEQPETERYLNHVVDRFDLRRHMRFDAAVTVGGLRRAVGNVDRRRVGDGTALPRAVPRRRDRRAVGAVLPRRARPRRLPRRAAPHRAVAGDAGRLRRQARRGRSAPARAACRSIPAIADEVASLTVYQRTANWCTPLNNAPITAEEQAAAAGRLRGDARDAQHVGRAGSSTRRTTAPRSTTPTRSAARSSRRCGTAPASRSSSSNYTDLLFDPAANAEWCEFIAEKIRGIVDDPETAEQADPEGPPLRREAAAVRHRLLRGVQPAERLARRPRGRRRSLRMTEHGIETADGVREFDIVVWATGFDFGTGALSRMGIRGRDGLALDDHWADGPTTFLGVQTTGFPNFFFPGGPHAAAGNNPRYNGDQVDFVTDTLVYARDHGYDTIEVDRRGRGAVDARWSTAARRRRRSARAATTSAPTSRASRASTS